MFFAERTDFISANREGLYSLVGYISLQFMGYGIGRFMLSNIITPFHLKSLSEGKPCKKELINNPE
jgi:hypothetical protein